jgi:hypothetical protein
MLVFPSSCVVGYRVDKHRPFDRSLSLKEPGWSVPTIPRLYPTLTLLKECLAEIRQPAGEQSESENSNFRQIFASKDVHLLAAFILVYVGIEDTIAGMSVMTTSPYPVPDSRRCSGWIVTYIIDVRGGGPSSGYISSGFFGGMSHLGRPKLYPTLFPPIRQ